MAPTGLTVAIGLVGGSGLLAAAETAAGTDLTGIALIITAVAGLVSAVGAVVIGLRRKPSDPATELALRLLSEQLRERDEGHDAP